VQLRGSLPWRYQTSQLASAGVCTCAVCYRGGIKQRSWRRRACAPARFATVAVSNSAIGVGGRVHLRGLLPWRYQTSQLASAGVCNCEVRYRGSTKHRNWRRRARIGSASTPRPRQCGSSRGPVPGFCARPKGWPNGTVALYFIAMVQPLRLRCRRPPRDHRDRLDSEEEEAH
jgi:hypothetical protein